MNSRSLVVFICLMGLSPCLHALTRAFTVESIAASSDLVIVGKVVDHSIYKDHLRVHNDADGEVFDWDDIFTQWTIEVGCTLKGDYGGKTLSVLGLGGKLETGESRSWTLSYQLNLGDVVLIFLTWDELNHVWWANNQAAGVFRVSDEGGRKRLNAVGDVHAIVPGSHAHLKRTGALLNAVWLDEVKGKLDNLE